MEADLAKGGKDTSLGGAVGGEREAESSLWDFSPGQRDPGGWRGLAQPSQFPSLGQAM